MKRKLPIILAIITSIGLIMAGCAPACPDIGDRAPNFTLSNIDGESLSLNDFKGNAVMVNFWSTRCPPCLSEMPHIQAVYNEQSNQGLVVLAINISDSAAIAHDFMASQGFTFTVLLDPQMKVFQNYCLPNAIPITLFINAEGIIKATKVGAFQSADEIERILKSL